MFLCVATMVLRIVKCKDVGLASMLACLIINNILILVFMILNWTKFATDQGITDREIMVARTLRLTSLAFLNLTVTFNCRNWIFYYFKIGERLPPAKKRQNSIAPPLISPLSQQIILHASVVSMLLLSITIIVVQLIYFKLDDIDRSSRVYD